MLAQRSSECRDESGLWDIGGGGLDFGEKVEDALKREVREEYCAEVLECSFLGFRDAHRRHEDMPTDWIALDYLVRVDPIQVKNGEPNKLTPDEEGLFEKEQRQIEGKETSVYVLGYGNVPEMSAQQKETGPYIPDDYFVAQPRKFVDYELSAKESLSPSELAEYIKDHKVVFYTSAGVSKSAGVPDMNSWQQAMGIDLKQNTDDFLHRAMHDPEANLASLQKFRKAITELLPTSAHEAIQKLAREKKCQVLTENSDLLHERSGIRPLRVSGEWLRENVREEWLKDVDAVVTVGLSADDRGILAWYKKHNPKGKIIAINRKQPDYVGSGDVVVEGDAQEILPEIERRFA